MRYKPDTEIDLKARTTGNYIISSQHRKKGKDHKSFWTITYQEEVECFILALNNQWKSGFKAEAWGFKHTNTILEDGDNEMDELEVLGFKHTNTILEVIGKNDNGQDLKLAKFVDGTNTNVWHGYPADYMNKAQDRPDTEILKKWVEKGFLTKSKMAKIRRGQSYNL